MNEQGEDAMADRGERIDADREIRGALGGWWESEQATAEHRWSDEDERYYREHYARPENQLADRRFEDIRPAYLIGHVGAANPEWRGKRFEEVEPELERAWHAHPRERRAIDWAGARRYTQLAWRRRMQAYPSGAEFSTGQEVEGPEI